MKKITLVLIAIVFILVGVNSVSAESIFKKKKNPLDGYGKQRTVITAEEWKAQRDAENSKTIKKTKTKDIKQVSIKVKGLYLGMFLNDAIKIYEEKLNQVGKSFKVRKVMTGTETYDGWMYGGSNDVFFLQTDKDKIVDIIYLSQEVHFNAGDISTKDFTRLFSEKYKISFKYEPLYYKGYTFDYYKYENASYIIQIGQGSIQLARKASIKKVSFD